MMMRRLTFFRLVLLRIPPNLVLNQNINTSKCKHNSFSFLFHEGLRITGRKTVKIVVNKYIVVISDSSMIIPM